MNSHIEKAPSAPVFSYRHRGHFSRFLIVYAFVFKRVLKLLWHYKIAKLFLSRESFLERDEKIYTKLGKEAKELFLNLGGVYIKLGQFLSNMGHLLPEYFIHQFQDLQDRIPPHPLEEIKNRFQQETGRTIDEVFPEIDPIPLASASTAQVYEARLGKEKVVIKILYPGIENLIQKDLKTVLFVMKRIDRYLINYDYTQIHAEVKEVIQREMNLLEEAKSIEKMAGFFEKEPDYVFPKVYHTYTTKGVLVTQYIDGIKISETKIVSKKHKKKSRALDLLVKAYILMVFKYKFFHADPHSGNLIYTKDGKLCFIDFGAVCEVNELTSTSLKKIIMAAMSKDYYGVVEGMEEMGFFERDADKEKLEQVARFGIEKLNRFLTNTDFFKNISLEQIDPEEAHVFLEGINSSLSDIMKMSRVPQNYVMLERTLGLIVGNAAIIDPYHSIFDYADTHFRTHVVDDNRTIIDQLINDESKALMTTSLQIPPELHKALLSVNRGRLVLQNKDIQKQTEKLYALGHQFIYLFSTIASIHFGNHFRALNEIVTAGFFFGLAAVSGLALLSSINKNRIQ